MEFIPESNAESGNGVVTHANMGVSGNTNWIPLGYVNFGQPVFQIEQPSARNGFTATVRAGSCCGCNRIFKSPDSAQMSCCRCHNMMDSCGEERICVWCHKPVCPSCGHTLNSGRWICDAHEFWR